MRRLFFILPILLFLAVGCGGGTHGTGGQDIVGRLVTPNDAPVSGITVTYEQTGATAQSDTSGTVTFMSAGTGEINFTLQGNGLSTQVMVTGVPADAALIVVTIIVNQTDNSAVVGSVDVSDDDEADDHSGSNSGSNSGPNGGTGGDDHGDGNMNEDDHGNNDDSDVEDDGDGSSSSDDGASGSSGDDSPDDHGSGSDDGEGDDHGNGGSSGSGSDGSGDGGGDDH